MTRFLLAFLLVSASTVAQASDKICLAFVTKKEAENQSLKAMRAVTDVVKNRMKAAGKSCMQIASSAHQFSWYRRNIRMKPDNKWLQRYKSSATMRPVLSEEYKWFFKADMRRPSWSKNLRCDRVVGAHRFCRLKQQRGK